MTPEQFKQFRKSKKLSQQEMAKLLGYEYHAIIDFEKGRRKIPLAIQAIINPQILKPLLRVK